MLSARRGRTARRTAGWLAVLSLLAVALPSMKYDEEDSQPNSSSFLSKLFSFRVKVEMEADVPLSALPAPVIDTVQKAYPGWHIDSAEQEQENGHVHYELEISQADEDLEVEIAPDGVIMEQ
jgi:hypothetical protein